MDGYDGCSCEQDVAGMCWECWMTKEDPGFSITRKKAKKEEYRSDQCFDHQWTYWTLKPSMLVKPYTCWIVGETKYYGYIKECPEDLLGRPSANPPWDHAEQLAAHQEEEGHGTKRLAEEYEFERITLPRTLERQEKDI